MQSIRILDCTLRDGGFINEWNFGIGSIKSIISRLDKAGIDIIEVGFLDKRREADINRTIQPNTASYQPVFDNLKISNAMIVGMIDFGTCDIEALADKQDTSIDGIRVIFKKKDAVEALAFCTQVKAKGYKIFVNPVSITGYTDEEMIQLLGLINLIEPMGVSVVDTYGLLHKKELIHYFGLMDTHLTPGVMIGYHAHNNFQLAYANSLELMALDSDRDLIIDGSLYGMGKGAGNTCTELLAGYLNANYGKHYVIDQLLEAIDVDISKEYAKKYWGYSLMHFMAASNDCHPDYVSTLIKKKTLSVQAINGLLSKLGPGGKLTFKKDLVESLYQDYQDNAVDDAAAYAGLRDRLQGRSILLVAPGKSIREHGDLLQQFIREKNPMVFTVNFLTEDITPDFVFMGNAKRYSQFYDSIHHKDMSVGVICTSNISELDQAVDFTFNFNALVQENPLIRDNPALMLLRILAKLGLKEVHIAGLDGYTADNTTNYFNEYIQFLYCDDNVLLRNDAMVEALKTIQEKVALRFLTPSLYNR